MPRKDKGGDSSRAERARAAKQRAKEAGDAARLRLAARQEADRVQAEQDAEAERRRQEREEGR